MGEEEMSMKVRFEAVTGVGETGIGIGVDLIGDTICFTGDFRGEFLIISFKSQSEDCLFAVAVEALPVAEGPDFTSLAISRKSAVLSLKTLMWVKSSGFTATPSAGKLSSSSSSSSWKVFSDKRMGLPSWAMAEGTILRSLRIGLAILGLAYQCRARISSKLKSEL